MSVTVTEIPQYQNYGRCVKISNNVIEGCVTVDVGPRIISFAFCGEENVLFHDLKRELTNQGPLNDEVFGEGSVWYTYGGTRLWTSPEHRPCSYYPDNERVQYEVLEGNRVRFTPPPQRVNDVQHAMELVLEEGSEQLQVHYYVTNLREETQTLAPWAITVMAQGGYEIIPQPTVNTDLLPNRAVALWPYANMADPRVFWGRSYITLRQDSAEKELFKCGINNYAGWAAYVLPNVTFVKHYSPQHPQAEYPDFGVSFETYTDSLVIELETLAPLHRLKQGETASHSEVWVLKHTDVPPAPTDEEGLKEFAEKWKLSEFPPV